MEYFRLEDRSIQKEFAYIWAILQSILNAKRGYFCMNILLYGVFFWIEAPNGIEMFVFVRLLE